MLQNHRNSTRFNDHYWENFTEDEDVDPESQEIDYGGSDEDGSMDDDFHCVNTHENYYLDQEEYGEEECIIHTAERYASAMSTQHNPVSPKLGEECCICLQHVEPKTDNCFCARTCGTVFHTLCISLWCSKRCPVCRNETLFEPCLQ